MQQDKIQRYPNATLLNARDHAHKNGLFPFIRGIEIMFAESGWPSPSLHLQHEGPTPRIDIHMRSEDFGLPSGHQVTPDEPLNLTTHRVDSASAERTVEDFGSHLQALAEGRGLSDILDVIRTEANLRNRILYAADNGIPAVQNVDQELLARRKRVLLLVGLTIIILQTKSHQLFAVQALQAYATIVGRSDVVPFDFDAAAGEPAELLFDVVRAHGGEPTAKIVRRFRADFCALDQSRIICVRGQPPQEDWLWSPSLEGGVAHDFGTLDRPAI